MNIFKQDPTLPQGFSHTFRKRFWKKVNKDGPVPPHMPHLGKCWLFGSRLFPQIKAGSIDGPNMVASRAMWLLVYGEVPCLCVLHHCDNPRCVNPEHLFLGTRADNTMDMVRKGRNVHKMTEQQVREAMRLKGIKPLREISAMFGVTRENISAIHCRKSWQFLDL